MCAVIRRMGSFAQLNGTQVDLGGGGGGGGGGGHAGGNTLENNFQFTGLSRDNTDCNRVLIIFFK